MSKPATQRTQKPSAFLPRIPASPRLPHPSWRLAGAGAADAAPPATADDFWQRLGL